MQSTEFPTKNNKVDHALPGKALSGDIEPREMAWGNVCLKVLTENNRKNGLPDMC